MGCPAPGVNLGRAVLPWHMVLGACVSGTEILCHGFVSIAGVSQTPLSCATWEAPRITPRPGGQALEWLQVPA